MTAESFSFVIAASSSKIGDCLTCQGMMMPYLKGKPIKN